MIRASIFFPVNLEVWFLLTTCFLICWNRNWDQKAAEYSWLKWMACKTTWAGRWRSIAQAMARLFQFLRWFSEKHFEITKDLGALQLRETENVRRSAKPETKIIHVLVRAGISFASRRIINDFCAPAIEKYSPPQLAAASMISWVKFELPRTAYLGNAINVFF